MRCDSIGGFGVSALALVVAVLAMVPGVAVGDSMQAGASDRIGLAGTWAVSLDPDDVGVEQGWGRGGYAESIRLPGSLQAQGFGERPTIEGPWTTSIGSVMLRDEKYGDFTADADFGSPLWLTPKRMYVGAAWYAREIEIPAAWRDRRVELFLERPHWGTTVYLNGERVGEQQDGLGVPHSHDLTEAIAAAGVGRHTLAIRVDNRVIVAVGLDAHAVSDQTQSNWNGIVGDIELRSTPMVWLDDVQVFPDYEARSARIEMSIGNATGEAGRGEISLGIESVSGRTFVAGPMREAVRWSGGERSVVSMEVPLGEGVPTWSEFDPNVLELTARLGDHSVETTFGVREIGVDGYATGSWFTVNGRRVFLRGTLECAVFPKTGYPPTDVASWREILQTIRAYGLNHVRFHSWCPPSAAFAAADELGMYLMPEASTWPNFSGQPALPGWLEAEGDRMLREYGNHPSFVLMGVGNEFWGVGGKLWEAAPMIEPAVEAWRERDTRRYYTTGAGWPKAPANDFHVTQDARLQLYPGLSLNDPPRTDLDYTEYIGAQSVPILTHEIGQWTAYPDVSKAARSEDVLEARFLEYFADGLARIGLGHLAGVFTEASGRFQTMLYNAEIETALRTPGLAGFQLLGLADFPGQGFAPVGVVDHNWQGKGYCGPEEYRRFAGERVLLARMPTRVMERGESIEIDLELANFGEDAVAGVLDWRVYGSASGVMATGSAGIDAAAGGLSSIPALVLDVPAGGVAEELTVRASVRGRAIENEWAVWAYPRATGGDDPDGVRVVRSIGPDEVELLEGGGRVVVMSPPAWVDADTFGSFRPIFWNRALFTTQREHTLGAVIDGDHPALAGFPSRGHVTWQWWDVLFNSKPIPLDALSSRIDPIVRPIDDWAEPRSLGLIFEARVGSGRLLVCAVDLETDLNARPAARALRSSLLSYAASDAFAPVQSLAGWELVRLFREPSAMQKLNAAVTASSSQAGYGPEAVLDGDPSTFWHTSWSPAPDPPHSLKIDLGRLRMVSGVRYTPRQDGDNGVFKRYRVEISDAGYQWSQIEEGEWSAAGSGGVRSVDWAARSARYVRLTMLESMNGGTHGSAAEVEVVVVE